VKGNGRSVSGYQGPCYAHFLPLDIDAPDLGDALETARDMAAYLLDGWGMTEEGLAAYYSGMKGFHLTIPTGIFGEVEPGADLPRTFRELRRKIVDEAKPFHPEAVDFAICDRMRLLRLPNTLHSKSGLYKVPLRLEELMTCEPDEIRRLARKPRRLWLTDDTGLLPRYSTEPVPEAVEMFVGCAERAAEKAHADLPDPGSFLHRGNLSAALCDAELELYREGVPEGSRSSVALRLASRLRSAGYAEEEASAMLESFAARCSPPMDAQEARHVVEAAYRAGGNGYQFGCGNGSGDLPHTALVRGRCPYADRRECRTYSAAVNGGLNGIRR